MHGHMNVKKSVPGVKQDVMTDRQTYKSCGNFIHWYKERNTECERTGNASISCCFATKCEIEIKAVQNLQKGNLEATAEKSLCWQTFF